MTMLFKLLPIRSLLIASALLLTTGCRNATTTPMGTGGAMSPLAPMQGSATLAPLQPNTGISTLGAPTRVPPPPTGSYTAPNQQNSSTGFGTPPANYAPTGFTPSGASLGTTGMTRGVTDLSPGVPAPVGMGVQQTGWVGDAPTNPNTFGGGFGAPPPVAAPQAPPTMPPTANPRTGGMQVIDLTQSPSPPGYAPPQYAPNSYQQPAAYPQAPPVSQQPNASPAPIGQPTNSTFVRSEGSAVSSSGFGAAPIDPVPPIQPVQTASRPSGAALPSTEPYASDAGAQSELQWRRPSPQF